MAAEVDIPAAGTVAAEGAANTVDRRGPNNRST